MRKPHIPPLREIDWKHLIRRLIASIGDGWYFHGDPMSQDRRRLVLCNYTSNVIANLVGGSFWTGLLLYLDADDGFIGTVTMIATAANMLQMFAPLLLERFPRRKKLLISLRSIMYLLNVLFIGLIPLFPVARQARLTLTALATLMVNLISALSSPGITIWHIQSLPDRVRQPYFTLVTTTNCVVIAIAILLGGKLVDLFRDAQMEYWGLMALRLIALVLCVVEIIMYTRIREYPYENDGERLRVGDLLTKPLRNRLYLLTVLVAVLWNFSCNLPSSYYTVYLLKNLGVSYTYLNLVNMMNVPVSLMIAPLWRKVLGKHGWFKTLYISMGLYALRYIPLAFTTSRAMFLYPIEEVFRFLFAIGINLAFAGIPYVNMPKSGQTAYIGFYSTCANLAALLGVTASKYFILLTGERTITILGCTMINKQYLMLLTTFLMLLAVLGIFLIDRRVSAQKAQS